MTLTLSTQLGIVAMGIIFAVGGILYAINYDFTPIWNEGINFFKPLAEKLVIFK